MRRLTLVCLVVLAACGRSALTDDELTSDGGAGGGGGLDASMPRDDAGTPDSGRQVDAGQPDAGQPDAGLPDAGVPDAGAPDAGLRSCEGRVTMGFELDYLDLERLLVGRGMNPMGIPPQPMDLKIVYAANRTPHAVVQNVNGAAIAVVANRTLATLTAADVAGATFTFVAPSSPFDATHVVLITTPALNTFALGNPAESTTHVSFDVRLLRGTCP